ncbi:prepilin peptidase [Candidatus Sumerlaeota bacterium]|nr:prepilin peptidase [Candidatus Sumerlaeota bacterium]
MPEALKQPHVINLVLLMAMMTVVVYYEVKENKVFNWLTLPMMFIGPLLNAMTFGSMPLFQSFADGAIYGLRFSAIGALFGFGLYFFVYVVGLMLNYRLVGGGDVKLMGAIGALCGFHFTWRIIYWTVWISCAMGLFMLVRRKNFLRGMTRAIRLFFLLPPDREDAEPVEEGGVHYCLAIAAAALLAMLELKSFT